MRWLTAMIIMVMLLIPTRALSEPPRGASGGNRIKFYDFNEMLIDGEIKKPTGLYTDIRQRARFERLLKLKRSFMSDLMDTALERAFK